MAGGFLTTHVLDTARGAPAGGLKIELFRLQGTARTLLAGELTNADGRTEMPILPRAEFAIGVYELMFHVGDYLESMRNTAPTPRFLDLVPIRFGVSEADKHYHVPLLISPFGYSTYRGS